MAEGPRVGRVPRVAKIHWDDNNNIFRVKLTWLDEASGNNNVGELIEKLLTLAEVIQLILQIWAAASPSGVLASPDMVGNVSALQKWISDNQTVDGKGIKTLGG